ncbi:pilus assembly protein PilM [Nocardioides bruguierae]|uniref:Pilus assembly protein PilM n=1 Tax=Nocardioides bruguierae TaxID=2945102 RepID=A0A9X2DAX8_9ACTN|nr:pilus assembly protein PilM [Nocardioides bruguierae]MCL8027629.1 pilus assembly protein PilM [Nocardioides bruguierae]MCM0622381.1 pilus assembly protein PilM [Nocardioides bruguierae]
MANLVGLEIGTSSVRAVEVRTRRGAPTLRRHARVPLPPRAVEAGVVRDDDAVAHALRELVGTLQPKARDVRLAVGSASVLVRQLELDWMSDEDLRRSLRYQVADLLPVPIDDANIDHLPLGEDTIVDEDGRTRRITRILLVASAREAVDGLVRAAQSAKLRVLSADLTAFAALRGLGAAGLGPAPAPQPAVTPVPTLVGAPGEEGERLPASAVAAAPLPARAVLDVGADTVGVTVEGPDGPRSVRVAAGLGGELLTRMLVEQTGRTRDEAEDLKRRTRLLPVPGAQPVDRDQALAQEAVSRMLAEVRATLDFQVSHDPRHSPTHMLLTGGGSLLPGLAEHCRAVVGLPVEVLGDGPHGPLLPSSDLVVPLGLCSPGLPATTTGGRR